MAELTAKDICKLVGTDSPTILEIGCNDGTDTMKFLSQMPGATIHCFEPDPRAIARFKTIANSPRITLYETAVGDVDGTAIFHGSAGQPPDRGPGTPHYCQLPEWDLSGSLYEPTGHISYCKWCTFPEDRQYKVAITRLDSWIRLHPEIAKIDFMWVDTQGGEASVILGATNTLAITRYFYTEFYNNPLYSGQVPLKVIEEMLSGRFTLVGTHVDNALFKGKI